MNIESADGHHMRLRVRWWKWALLAPAVWISWTVAVIVGYALHDAIDRLCPPELQVSGLCTARWYPWASKAIFSFGASLAAALMLSTCTLLAPSHRRTVAVVTFAVGSAVALVMALMLDAWFEAMTAIAVGWAVTQWLRNRYRDQSLVPPSAPTA